jgi:hypothetical protein
VSHRCDNLDASRLGQHDRMTDVARIGHEPLVGADVRSGSAERGNDVRCVGDNTPEAVNPASLNSLTFDQAFLEGIHLGRYKRHEGCSSAGRLRNDPPA